MIITDYKFYKNDEDAEEDKTHTAYLFLINFDTEEVETNCGDFITITL